MVKKKESKPMMFKKNVVYDKEDLGIGLAVSFILLFLVIFVEWALMIMVNEEWFWFYALLVPVIMLILTFIIVWFGREVRYVEIKK